MNSGRSSGGKRREPAARGSRLLMPEVGQGHVDVAQVDVDLVRAGLVGGVARDIALALAMAHEPQSLGPVLAHEMQKASASRLCQNRVSTRGALGPVGTPFSR